MSDRRGDERGFASLVVAGLTGLVVVTMIAVALVGGVLEAAHRTQAAADLAALAGAQARQQWRDACAEADWVAAAHGARVEQCTVDGEDVTVVLVCDVVPVAGILVVPSVRRQATAGPEEMLTAAPTTAPTTGGSGLPELPAR